MDVLEAYDLTKSLRGAGKLTGVDHHSVANLVEARASGKPAGEPVVRSRLVDSYVDKIEEWVEKSSGKIRADVVHDKLVAIGYTGSDRSTRRAVRTAKANYHNTTHRIYKPWIVEPGLWLQYDFGDGPKIGGIPTVLFCAWLAWSRYRVIIALRDKTLPSVIAALDQTFRVIGGCPTYVLTDNEKTVTDYHVAGIAVRNQMALDVSRYYGFTLATCVTYDPESKGGSERTVGIAKADLVPTEYNLLDNYSSFGDLQVACKDVGNSFNNRVHSVTRQVPASQLEQERLQLHPVADSPYSACFGESRAVGWSSTISFRAGRYSVPHAHCGGRVWARVVGDEVVIVAGEGSGAAEVARHPYQNAGGVSINDAHYPPKTCNPLERQPKATNQAEVAFLALGEGARLYLTEAAGSGARSITRRMAEAVTLAKLHGDQSIDTALSTAAIAGRFASGDLESIIVHAKSSVSSPGVIRAQHSLAQGTSSWSGYSTTGKDDK